MKKKRVVNVPCHATATLDVAGHEVKRGSENEDGEKNVLLWRAQLRVQHGGRSHYNP